MKPSVKRTGRQFFGLVLPVPLFIMLLAGCRAAPGEEKTGDMRTPTDGSLIVVGVSWVDNEPVWRTANTASIRKAFTKENGYFLTFDSARQKQKNQIKAPRSFISQWVGYIVLSPIAEDGWDTVLREAKKAGIPVILVDRRVNVKDRSLYTTWIGSDFQKEGQMAGETLAGYLKARGRQKEDIRMVVLQGTKGVTVTIGRSTGFDEVAKLHPNWLIPEWADAEFTMAKGQEEMKRLLTRYGDIDVVISQNDDTTSGALDAIHQAGKTTGGTGDILVIPFDAVEDALKLVEDGITTADTEYNPSQGEYAEVTIRQLESGKIVDEMNFLPERVFTKEDIQEFRSGSDG